MLIILVNGIVYGVYGALAWNFFENITPFSFTILFYVAPLVINMIFSAIYTKKNKTMRGKLISPVFSTITYILLGFVSQRNGVWEEFVTKYMVDRNEVSISIASSMITLSQIAFVILLYFGINYLLTTIIMKKWSEK